MALLTHVGRVTAVVAVTPLLLLAAPAAVAAPAAPHPSGRVTGPTPYPAPAAVAAPAAPHPSGRVTGPTPYPAPAFNDPAGHTCPFAIHVSFPVNKTKVYTYHDHGRITAYIYVGALYAKVTRRSTGVSRTVDLSASGVQILHQDGSSDLYGFGPFASLLHPGDSPHREFAILHGVSLVRFLANGHKQIVYSSRVYDLCDRLR